MKNYILFAIGLTVLLPVGVSLIFADAVSSTVTVLNTAPTFTVDVAESPASDGTTPTDVGDSVTFQATATDSASEDYYLAICQTNAITANDGAAPSCPGGAWAISSATSSGVQATASYTALVGDTESNDWYAFVCDGNASSAECSASSQGSGSSGSPFKVNHSPSFTTALNDGPFDPGDTVTFTTTASDSDTDTVSDTVTLVVCRTQGISGTACDGGGGDTWCTSTASASNPSCNFSLPAVQAAGSLDAYVYVFDNHGLAATGSVQDDNRAIVINNVAPVITAVTLNGGSDITLTEGTTTSVPITATISDDNGCTTLSTISTSVYRSGITYTGCDSGGEADNNHCYVGIVCSVSGGSCTGASDASANYTCSASIQYHADPTVSGTLYPAENWLNRVYANDGFNIAAEELTVGVEMQSLIGVDVTSSIDFGLLTPGNDTSTLSEVVNVSATGNVGLDVDLSGTNLSDGGNNIPVGNLEYALSAVAYGSGTDLSGTDTELELNVAKTTSTGLDENTDAYWGLLVPLGTATGSYSGTVSVTGVVAETGDW